MILDRGGRENSVNTIRLYKRIRTNVDIVTSIPSKVMIKCIILGGQAATAITVEDSVSTTLGKVSILFPKRDNTRVPCTLVVSLKI